MSEINVQNSKKWLRYFGSKAGLAIYLVAVLLFLIGMTAMFVSNQHGDVEFNQHRVRFLLATLIGMFAVCHIPILLRRCLNLKVPIFFDIYMLLAAFGHAYGHLFALYEGGWHFDKILHTMAGAAFALIGFAFIPLIASNKQVANKKAISIVFMIVFAIGFSSIVALLWEFLEFGIDSIFGHNSQRWRDALKVCENGLLYYFYHNGTRYYATSARQGSGLLDTMWDMVWHFVGSVLIGVILFVIHIKKPELIKTFFVEKQEKTELMHNAQSTMHNEGQNLEE